MRKPPFDLEQLIGQSVTFTCVVSGIPTPTVTWYHNGAELSADGVISISGNTLNISSLTVGHTGMYQCFANNVVGSTHHSWALQVREPRKGIPPSHSPPTHTHTHTHKQCYVPARVPNSKSVQLPYGFYIWIRCRGIQHAVNIVSCENTAIKKWVLLQCSHS